MGLDISVYKKIRKIGKFEVINNRIKISDNWNPEEGQFIVYNNESFVGREAPFENGDVCEGEDFDGFYAGSYSYYNKWRRCLAELTYGSTYPIIPYHLRISEEEDAAEKFNNLISSWRGKPFFELVYFSDAEGLLGPDVCRKLANDFNIIKSENIENIWFFQLYNEFKRVFNYSLKEDIAVRFH